MSRVNLSITRYRSTRHWAVLNNGELLTVAVYRKGAQAVCNFINTLTPNNSNTKMSKKTKKAAKATETEQVTVLVENKRNGERMRAALSHDGTDVCFDTKGAWHRDAHYSQPLPELMEQGLLRPANQRAREAVREFFGEEAAAKKPEKPAKASKEKKSKKPAKAEEPEAVAAPQDDDEVAWRQITAEREEQRNRELEAAAAAIEPGEDEHAAEPAPLDEPDVAEPLPQAVEPDPAPAATPAPAQRASDRKLVSAVVMPGETEPQPIPADIVLKPGMRLVRQYKGATYEVEVTEDGFKWEGEVYPTLTHISWKVTPYKAGGTTFFGIPAKHRTVKH